MGISLDDRDCAGRVNFVFDRIGSARPEHGGANRKVMAAESGDAGVADSAAELSGVSGDEVVRGWGEVRVSDRQMLRITPLQAG